MPTSHRPVSVPGLVHAALSAMHLGRHTTVFSPKPFCTASLQVVIVLPASFIVMVALVKSAPGYEKDQRAKVVV